MQWCLLLIIVVVFSSSFSPLKACNQAILLAIEQCCNLAIKLFSSQRLQSSNVAYHQAMLLAIKQCCLLSSNAACYQAILVAIKQYCLLSSNVACYQAMLLAIKQCCLLSSNDACHQAFLLPQLAINLYRYPFASSQDSVPLGHWKEQRDCRQSKC